MKATAGFVSQSRATTPVGALKQSEELKALQIGQHSQGEFLSTPMLIRQSDVPLQHRIKETISVSALQYIQTTLWSFTKDIQPPGAEELSYKLSAASSAANTLSLLCCSCRKHSNHLAKDRALVLYSNGTHLHFAMLSLALWVNEYSQHCTVLVAVRLGNKPPQHVLNNGPRSASTNSTNFRLLA